MQLLLQGLQHALFEVCLEIIYIKEYALSKFVYTFRFMGAKPDTLASKRVRWQKRVYVWSHRKQEYRSTR